MPSPRRAGLIASRSRPSSRTAPPLGSTKPAIICKVVVLPQPDGPSSETNSPFSTPRQRLSTARCEPKRLLRFSRTRKLMARPASLQQPSRFLDGLRGFPGFREVAFGRVDGARRRGNNQAPGTGGRLSGHKTFGARHPHGRKWVGDEVRDLRKIAALPALGSWLARSAPEVAVE